MLVKANTVGLFYIIWLSLCVTVSVYIIVCYRACFVILWLFCVSIILCAIFMIFFFNCMFTILNKCLCIFVAFYLFCDFIFFAYYCIFFNFCVFLYFFSLWIYVAVFIWYSVILVYLYFVILVYTKNEKIY